jgi:hypothetical protein
MKISRDALAYGKTTRFNSISDAVEDAATPSHYSYDGQIEGLQSEIRELRELVARLVEQLPLSKANIKAILGSSYEVEE